MNCAFSQHGVFRLQINMHVIYSRTEQKLCLKVIHLPHFLPCNGIEPLVSSNLYRNSEISLTDVILVRLLSGHDRGRLLQDRFQFPAAKRVMLWQFSAWRHIAVIVCFTPASYEVFQRRTMWVVPLHVKGRSKLVLWIGKKTWSTFSRLIIDKQRRCWI